MWMYLAIAAAILVAINVLLVVLFLVLHQRTPERDDR